MTVSDEQLTNDKIQSLYEEKQTLMTEWGELKRFHEADEWDNERDERFVFLNGEFDRIDSDIAAERERVKRHLAFETREQVIDRAKHTAKSADGNDGARTIEDGLRGTTLTRALLGFVRGKRATQDENKAMQLMGWVGRDEIELKMPGFSSINDLFTNQIASGEMTRSKMKEWLDITRQQGTTPDAAGGYTVPQGMMQRIDIALKFFAGQRNFAQVLRTDTGRAVPWPTTSDVDNLGEIIAENAATNQQDIVFAQKSTKPHMYSSKYVPVSLQLMQDSNENMEALVGQLLGERIGRVQAAHFTTGAGTTEPEGLVTGAADSGITFAAANTPTLAELLGLKYSVDKAYRQAGHGWVLHDQHVLAIRQLALTNGQALLWEPSLAPGEPNLIDGDRYYVINELPTGVGADVRTMAYGQLDKYKIHDATSLIIRRLDEVHALNHQVTFLAFMRSDGMVLDAGTGPIAYASNPAS